MSGTTNNNWHSFVGPEDDGRVITSAEWQSPDDPKSV
jgi:hypothetical protein